MTPEKFARSLLAINMPLTKEEWYLLLKLFEKISPGITACVDRTKNNQEIQSD